MRLIRATTSDSSGRFDGVLNTDLTLKPMSKIALEQLALEIAEAEIQIDDNNEGLTFSQGGTDYDANILNDVYSTNDGDRLLNNITQALNDTADFIPDGIKTNTQIQGGEYRAGVNTSGKVQIEFRKGTMGELPFVEWEASDDVVHNAPAPPAQLSWDAGNAAIADGKCAVMMATSGRIPNGNAYMECTIYDCAANAVTPRSEPKRSGVWLFYTDEDIRNITPNDLRDALETEGGRAVYCKYGVGVDVQSTPGNVEYLIIKEGVATPFTGSSSPAFGPITGDITNPRIRLQRAGDHVYAYYADTDTTGIERLTEHPIKTIDKSQSLYQVIVFWDNDAHIEISQVQGAISSFANEAIVQTYDELTYGGLAEFGLSAAIKTIYYQPQGFNANYNLYPYSELATANSFEFASDTLASFLGYRNKRIPNSGTRSGVNFLAAASSRYEPRITSETLILLSESLPISSYDTTPLAEGEGQRRSILAVIPTKDSGGSIAYQASNLNFLDLANKDPITLRNLRFRLVAEDYSPFRLYGKASIVVLVKEPEEF